MLNFSFFYIFFKITAQQQNWLLRHLCPKLWCPALPSLLRLKSTGSFLDVQCCQYVQGGIRAGEMPVHVVIISYVLCWITCFLSWRKAPQMVNLKQAFRLWNRSWNLIRGTLWFVSPAAFFSWDFGWKRSNPASERASFLLVAKALAFKAGKQIHLRGFSGHLNYLYVGFGIRFANTCLPDCLSKTNSGGLNGSWWRLAGDMELPPGAQETSGPKNLWWIREEIPHVLCGKHTWVREWFEIFFLLASEIYLLLNKIYMLTYILMIYCCII